MNVLTVTAENYTVPAGEEHLYHVKQEVRQFDRNTGARLSVPRIQKYGKKAYENVIYDELLAQGYTIEVLHNPNDYFKAQEAFKAAKAAEIAEAKAKAEAEATAAAEAAEAERYAAEKEKMRAEILAELKANGTFDTVESSEDETPKKSKKTSI